MLVQFDVVEAEGATVLQNGLLSGFTPRAVLDAAIAELGIGEVPPALVEVYLQSLLDIDADGDGREDAMSVGVMFEALQVEIVGSTP